MNLSKRFFFVPFLLTLVVILSVNTIQAQETPSPAPSPSTDKPVDQSIVQTKIASAIMAEDRRVIIHLPRNYAFGAADKFLSFIEKELIPLIEKNKSTAIG